MLDELKPFFDKVAGDARLQNILYVKLWGSHSHNTSLVGSDYDYLAVYMTSTAKVLSLEGYTDSVVFSKPDVEAHEVGKFCRLLLKGNPAQIEMLFTERSQSYQPAWKHLRVNRQKFLSKAVLRQYLGYANGQLARLKAGMPLHAKHGAYNTKFSYHLMRLLGDALSISKGGEPAVWKATGSFEHTLLMDIRRGVFTVDQIIGMAEKQIAQVTAAAPWPLPETGDQQMLDDWLYDLRCRDLTRGRQIHAD